MVRALTNRQDVYSIRTRDVCPTSGQHGWDIEIDIAKIVLRDFTLQKRTSANQSSSIYNTDTHVDDRIGDVELCLTLRV